LKKREAERSCPSRTTKRLIGVFPAQEEERGHDRRTSQHVITNDYIYDVTPSLIILSNVSSIQDDAYVKHVSNFEEYGKTHCVSEMEGEEIQIVSR